VKRTDFMTAIDGVFCLERVRVTRDAFQSSREWDYGRL